MSSPYSSKSSLCRIACAARNWIILSPKQQRRPLPFLLCIYICILLIWLKFCSGKVFLDTIRQTEKIKNSKLSNIDPRWEENSSCRNKAHTFLTLFLGCDRSAARTPAANKEPRYGLRYTSPAWASPSRDTLHARYKMFIFKNILGPQNGQKSLWPGQRRNIFLTSLNF